MLGTPIKRGVSDLHIVPFTLQLSNNKRSIVIFLFENILNSDYFYADLKLKPTNFSDRNTIITQLLMLRKGFKEYHCESPLKVSNANLKRKLPEK